MNLQPVQPKVTLLGYSKPIDSDNPERLVASAAKLCYSKSSPSTLLDGLDDKKTEEFLSRLSNYGHFSPTEHISFTFGIEGISRACSHQIVRHRIASYSQQSQRYVDLSSAETIGFVVPEDIKDNEELLEKYINSVKMEFDFYQAAIDSFEEKYKSEMYGDEEITKKQATAIHKKALEDARYLLPNACETKLVMTMNARSLFNFFSERCCERAQWEIRDVANQMLEITSSIAPTLFENAGAPCISGKCPEGAMSCGHPKTKKIGSK